MARLFSGDSSGGSARGRWADRIVGILVGLALGLGVLVYFVFVHSEGTIDAPKVNEGAAGKTAEGGAGSNLPAHPGSPEEPAEGGSSGPEAGSGGQEGAGAQSQSGTAPESGGSGQEGEAEKPVPVVKVIGGAPPEGSGPKQLHFTKGEEVRFEIETSEPFSFEIKGLGITKSIPGSSTISFEATRAGQFPVIATATLIGVADLLISPKK
jgi:hypothetical protein